MAIPDFAFGAMENLGCVTFRETALLVDPDKAARTELERVADVVAHELAHMWFGDLVTMRWWEGIWLNEAFATFMEMLCIDDFRPGWQSWVSFGISREAALAIDDLHSTRPIEYPVGSPAEADGMFDVLTYEKGASVLRMLEQYLGPRVFRDGVRSYLGRHAYANTVTADLWDALEAASGEPVRAVMDSWILQGATPWWWWATTPSPSSPSPTGRPARGRPAPSVSTGRCRCWSGRCRAGRRATGRRAPCSARPPPACPPTPPGGVRVVNAGGWGVYRTAYAAPELAGLARPAGRPGHPGAVRPARRHLGPGAGRPGRADGFLALAAGAGRRAGTRAPGPWWSGRSPSATGWRSTATARPSRAAVRALLGPRLARLGWDPAPGEGERTPSLRALLVAALGTLGADPAVRAEAARRFDASRQRGADRAPTSRRRCWPPWPPSCARGLRGDARPATAHPATPQDELRYLYALAAFPDAGPGRAHLRPGRSTRSAARTRPYLVAALLANRVGGPAVWERVTANWDELLARFPANSHSPDGRGRQALCGDPALADGRHRFPHRAPRRARAAHGGPDARAPGRQRRLRRAGPTRARRGAGRGRRGPPCRATAEAGRRRPSPGPPTRPGRGPDGRRA